jgi:exoribonuclease R
MYKFSPKDRSYTTWEVIEDLESVPLEICPVNSKLFDSDIFTLEDGIVTICDSPIRRKSIAGVLILENDMKYGKKKDKFLYRCIPDDRHLPIFLVSYKINRGFNKALKNRYVIIYFRNWDGKHPIGYIDQNLGEVDNTASFYQYQLYCKNLNSPIKKITKAAKCRMKNRQEDDMINDIIKQYSVTDRRGRDIVTIDPVGSKDFDDGFGIIDNGKGYILSIYIANVAIWLDFLGLWKSFSRRISTIYLPDRRLPMLPTVLSDVLCSLQEDCSRFALALDIYINTDYTIERYELNNTVISVSKNLRYDTEEMEKYPLYKSAQTIIYELNKKTSYVESTKSSHDVIAYMMIMMNNICAGLLFENDTGIYRSMTYGETVLPTTVEDCDTRNFLKGWHGTGGNYNNIRNMGAHEALNLDKYVHITSPIRRLVDLLNMIQIQDIGLSEDSNTFYKGNTTDENIIFINETMRSIRKLQNDCSLLHSLVTTPDILSKIHRGFVFDKTRKDDGSFCIQVYMSGIRIVRKVICLTDVAINRYYDFRLYLFTDEELMYQKVRATMLI